MDEAPRSWGRVPRGRHRLLPLSHRHELPRLPADQTCLPHGLGRSYGDSNQNDGGTLLLTPRMDRLLAFDAQTGVLDCEAGVTLRDIAAFALPRGWFLPVTPGTQYVTVGGAIGNDVHGKNHHRAGSFGCHVLGFELLRSDGMRLQCSPHEHADWFGATLAGLGLTGLVTCARLQLRRVPGPWIEAETLPFAQLADCFALSQAAADTHEYTVAWIDCSAPRGRGLFTRGNHVAHDAAAPRASQRSVPLTPPLSLVNGCSTPLFNRLYRAAGARQRGARIVHYQPFFYPLDGLLQWNRLYGPRGFYQYQCVLPMAAAQDGFAEMLARIAAAGEGSMLSVLKVFGAARSPGWLSFPRPGTTLALDFPNRGARTLRLLDTLDAITQAAGGAVYPAKDARMSTAVFRAGFPRWAELEARRDPAYSSSFWRRLTQ